MLYWLTALSDGGDVFNLFRYITFRAGGAFLTALIFGFTFGVPLINVLRRRQGRGQPIRTDSPESHFVKAGTPTMGGLLIVGATVTEGIFNVPGVGNTLYQAIIRGERPTVVSFVTVMVLFYLVVNILVDLLYAVLDPRIRYAK